MSSDTAAILILALYAAAALGLIVLSFRRSGLSLSAWFLWGLERLYVALFFHWRANRRCPFPDRGPALIVANHRSPVDPLLIWMNHHLGPRKRPARIIGFLTAKEYYDIPGLKWVCRSMQSIPVSRQGKDMRPAREALEHLKRGHLLGVFPEGRINAGEALLEGDIGIAWLALHAQVPIYPVYLRHSLTGTSMLRPFFTPTRVQVLYGDPIDLSDYYPRRKTHRLLCEVTDVMMRRLAELGGVPYAKDACRPSPHVAARLPAPAERATG
jgi:1-acyl-sn-glycerol-3-phosphate acyltransferase